MSSQARAGRWLLAFLMPWSCAHPPTPGSAPAPAPAGPIEVTLVPESGDGRVVQLDAAGVKRSVSGAWRAEISAAGDVSWSEDAMPDRILGAWPGGRGWVFVAADGVVARAPGFLARAERVGELPGRLRLSEGSEGVPWAVAGGRVWSLDGDGAPASLPVQPPGDTLAVWMFDARAGLALLDGGGLARTGDAGGSWSAIDLGVNAAYELYPGKKGPLLYTVQGTYTVSPDGALTPTDENLESSPRIVAPPAEIEQKRQRVAVTGIGDTPGPNGTVLIYWKGTLRALDPATGRVVRDLTTVLPDDTCSPVAWGTTSALECHAAVYRLTPDFTLELVAHIDRSRWSLTYSDDGQHLVAIGQSCPGGPPVHEARILCALDPSTRAWRELPVDASKVERAYALHGERLALVRDGTLVLMAVDSGRVVEEPLAPQADAPWRLEPWLPPDGTLVLAARSRHGVRQVAVRAPDGTMTYGELPAEVHPLFGPDFFFFDARRGLAVGMSYRDFALTADGGRHWELVHGRDAWLDLMTTPWYEAGDAPLYARCTPAACDVQGLVFRAGGRPVLGRDDVVAASTARAARPTSAEPEPEDAALRLACAPAEPAPAGAVRAFENDVASVTLTDVRGGVELRWATPGGVRGSSGAIPRLGGAFDAGPVWHYLVPVLASADRLDFLSCAAASYPDCEEVEARRGRARWQLTLSDAAPGAGGLFSRDIAGVLPLPGGGAAVYARSHSGGSGDRDVLLALGADGRVATRRAYAWAPRRDKGRRRRGLAVHDGRVGLAVESADDTTRWRFLPVEGAPVDLPPVRLRDAGQCADAAAAPTVLHLDTRALLSIPGVDTGVASAVTFEVGPQRTCWRALRVNLVPAKIPAAPEVPVGVAHVRAGPGGVQADWVDGGGQRRTLRCPR